jgi:hypothetical protein
MKVAQDKGTELFTDIGFLKTKVGYYVRKLADGNPINRENAAKSIYEMYSDAHLVYSEDKKTPEFAVAKKLMDKTLLKPLSDALLEDKSAQVRRQAALALGTSYNKDMVAPLAAALQDEDSGVAKYAAASLGKLGGTKELLPYFLAAIKREDIDENMKAGIAEGLGNMFEYSAKEGGEPYYILQEDRKQIVTFLLEAVGESGPAALRAAMALKDAAYFTKTLEPMRELRDNSEVPEVKKALSKAISALEERIAVRGGAFRSGKSPSQTELEQNPQKESEKPRKRAIR